MRATENHRYFCLVAARFEADVTIYTVAASAQSSRTATPGRLRITITHLRLPGTDDLRSNFFRGR